MVVHKVHSSNTSTDWCAVVAHGGGQIHYGNTHPLVEFLLNHVHTVYSFDLPQHGSYSRTPLENPVRDALRQVYDTLSPIIRNRKIIFVSFSVGALLLMKQWARITSICLDYIGIFIGSGLRGDIELCKKWTSFWDAETITAQKRDRMMLSLHGETWRNTARFVQFVSTCDPTLELYCTEQERNFIIGDKRVYFIIGTNEQVFPIDEITSVLGTNSKCKLFNGTSVGHFDYFTSGWVNVQPILENILGTNELRSKL